MLVVIGILIALSIDNWNEDRKEQLNESRICKTLHDEFLQNSITLDSTMEILNYTIEALVGVMNIIDRDPDLTFSPKQLDSILNETMANPYWKRSEYTLRNLENSGKLSSLTNEDLKTRLYEYSLLITDIKDKDEDATIGFNYLLNYYKEKGSLRNLDSWGSLIMEGRTSLHYDHYKFFSDIIFENAIDDCLVYQRQRLKRYLEVKKIMDQIIEITLSEK